MNEHSPAALVLRRPAHVLWKFKFRANGAIVGGRGGARAALQSFLRLDLGPTLNLVPGHPDGFFTRHIRPQHGIPHSFHFPHQGVPVRVGARCQVRVFRQGIVDGGGDQIGHTGQHGAPRE